MIGPKLIWCERGDSNPHGFTRQILSLVRLPIPPLSHTMIIQSGGARHSYTQQAFVDAKPTWPGSVDLVTGRRSVPDK